MHCCTIASKAVLATMCVLELIFATVLFWVPPVILGVVVSQFAKRVPDLVHDPKWVIGSCVLYPFLLTAAIVCALDKSGSAGSREIISATEFWLVVGPMSAVSSLCFALSFRSSVVAAFPIMGAIASFVCFVGRWHPTLLWIPWLGAVLGLGAMWYLLMCGEIRDRCPTCHYPMADAKYGDLCSECGAHWRPYIDVGGKWQQYRG